MIDRIAHKLRLTHRRAALKLSADVCLMGVLGDLSRETPLIGGHDGSLVTLDLIQRDAGLLAGKLL